MNSEMREPAQHLSPPLRQSGGNTAPTQEHAIPVSLKLFVQLFVCKAKYVPARGRDGVRRYMTALSRRVKAGGVGAGGEVARELQRAQSMSRPRRLAGRISGPSRTFRAPAARTAAPKPRVTRKESFS